jgi:hypothetical protein
LLREKCQAFRKWKKYESNTWRATYKMYVKRVKQHSFIAKRDYFLRSLDGCHDPGSFWRSLNRFTGRKQRENIPTLKTQSGDEATTNNEKAEALMLQFASVFQPCEPETNTSLSPLNSTETIRKASARRILHIISHIPTKKACGCDEIPMVVIKKIVNLS